jgi:hypothetical protein
MINSGDKIMSRISIDVTSEQHNRLKAVAALAGQSLKDYVLTRTLPRDEDKAMQDLIDFLEPRAEQARKGHLVNKSVTDIAEEVYKELGV